MCQCWLSQNAGARLIHRVGCRHVSATHLASVWCTTKRTSTLLMPMPKATVATTICMSPATTPQGMRVSGVGPMQGAASVLCGRKFSNYVQTSQHGTSTTHLQPIGCAHPAWPKDPSGHGKAPPAAQPCTAPRPMSRFPACWHHVSVLTRVALHAPPRSACHCLCARILMKDNLTLQLRQ